MWTGHVCRWYLSRAGDLRKTLLYVRKTVYREATVKMREGERSRKKYIKLLARNYRDKRRDIYLRI